MTAASVTKEASVQKALAVLFSEGLLADKIQSANDLNGMSGLGLFITPVSWRITSTQGVLLNGSSENMRFAVRDIHAQLVYLEKKLPLETPVTIEIDKLITRITRINQ